MEKKDAAGIMAQYAAILKKLNDEKVVRTHNSPVGDYAEWLTAETLKLSLCRNSKAGYDAIDEITNVRYQVKSRWDHSGKGTSFVFNVIRDLDKGDPFDFLIAIVFAPDFSVKKAYRIAVADVRRITKHNAHQNGRILTINSHTAVNPAIEDITNLF